MQKKVINTTYKIAMVAPVPFYYQIPLFQKLAESSKINFKVYYCSDETVSGADVEKMYNTKNKFSNAENLLKGYSYNFLKNYSLTPSFLKWPFGLVNFGIWKEIKNNKYDAVILQAWNNFTWLLAFFACLVFKTPIILMTDANVLEEEIRSQHKKLFKKIFLKGFIFKSTSGFLTTSSVNENLYEAYGVPKEKMAKLYYSYGYEQFFAKANTLRPQKNILRKSFGAKKNDFILLFVGRLVEDKNILVLLDAFSKISSENKKLFIIGDGAMKDQIEQYAEKVNIKGVRFFGFQSRDVIPSFYSIADALVLPSIDEPWGMVVNEAMCFSLPVIVSDQVGAGVDLVKNGYNGFIFPVANSEDLAICIKNLADMPAKDRDIFGKRSFEIISKWISSIEPEKQIIKILKIIK